MIGESYGDKDLKRNRRDKDLKVEMHLMGDSYSKMNHIQVEPKARL